MGKRKPKDHPPARSVDLHRLNALQAKGALLDFIDRNSGAVGVDLEVIHGMGTGVLAEVVAEVGRIDPRVVSVRRSESNRGVSYLTLGRPTDPRRGMTTRLVLDLDEPPERRRKRR